MQWILQDIEDSDKLAEALRESRVEYSVHTVIPFVGELIPEPTVNNPNAVVMFGSYILWRTAEAKNYKPGVFKLRPFVHEKLWHPYLLNGADGLFMTLRDIPQDLPDNGKDWFIRPVDDSKEIAGNVESARDIILMAERVLALDENEIPNGSLRHDTQLMLNEPARILKEWRLWIVDGQVVTYSLYKEGARVVYRHKIDDDALQFARHLVDTNPNYSRAYVIDICRTEDGLRMLETNCINASGFYEADLAKLINAINIMKYN